MHTHIYIFIFHGRSAISWRRFLPASRDPWSPASHGQAPAARGRTRAGRCPLPGALPARPHTHPRAPDPWIPLRPNRTRSFRAPGPPPAPRTAQTPGLPGGRAQPSRREGRWVQGKGPYLIPRRRRPRAAPLAAAAGGWRRRGAAAPSSASPAARPPAPAAARRGARRCPAWRAARGQRRHIAGGRRRAPHPRPRRRLCGGTASPPTDVPGRGWGGAERGHRPQGPGAASLRAGLANLRVRE